MDIDRLYWMTGKCLDYCQRIEHDVFLLLSLLSLRSGMLLPEERRTLGQDIRLLQEADVSHFLSDRDYGLLRSLRNRRNHLVHELYASFRYAEDAEVEGRLSASFSFAEEFLEDLSLLWKAVEDARIQAYEAMVEEKKE